MDMSLPPEPIERRPSRWRRVRRRLNAAALVVLLLVSVVLGLFSYLSHAVERRFRDAASEADRLDPGWRIEQIEARRDAIPDAENSAFRVLIAAKLIPNGWLSPKPAPRGELHPSRPLRGYDLWKSVDAVEPTVQLDESQVAALHDDLDELAPAVEIARGLAELPRGRYAIKRARNTFNTLLPHAHEARIVARLLRLDAIRRAQDGDIDGALDSSRAMLNAGRSIGDEPFLISQLVRIAIVGMAAATIERVLALGEPSEAALHAAQDLLTDEADAPRALIALRGERAIVDDLYTKLETGEVTFDELSSSGNPAGRGKSLGPAGNLYFRYNHALSLEFLNRAVEIAKKPGREQLPLWDRWKKDSKPLGNAPVLGALTYLALPADEMFARASIRQDATLDLAALMIAVERYRRARGHWPESLDALVPEFIAAVPPDPFARRGPMKLVRREDDATAESLLVYSFGTDETDNGGRFDSTRRTRPGYDLGFQLWDVAQRRHAPKVEAAPVTAAPIKNP